MPKTVTCNMPPGNPVCFGAGSCDPAKSSGSNLVCTYPVVGGTCADDGNQCTSKTCSASGVCPVFQTGTNCNDQNPCTLNDKCSDATMTHGLKGCVGTNAPSGTACNTDPCQQHQTCDGNGKCVGTPVIDGTACTTALCSKNGLCISGVCSCGLDMSVPPDLAGSMNDLSGDDMLAGGDMAHGGAGGHGGTGGAGGSTGGKHGGCSMTDIAPPFGLGSLLPLAALALLLVRRRRASV